ncbi:hypothetical protein [Shinella sedimenti]|uniref:Strictosidine synthase conserved region domain-containing protein n=1 Tax=Shinella sedimenti TaxID=2919913 RepID=A0ABT0CNG4_9HYPH|nr:hypothetical protein [Shinella sedimenti]MCJ8150135.1 hypothetical protein [Shinella sedimenti]
MTLLDRLLDPFRGEAITIPPYDGAWKPNTDIETAARVASLPEADNLVQDAEGEIWLTAGYALYRLDARNPTPVERFSSPVTALAAPPRGGLAIATADGGLMLRRNGETQDLRAAFPAVVSATALLAGDDNTLLVAQGSAHSAATDWVQALMRKQRDGAIWRLDLSSGKAERIADGLAFPAGLALDENGAPVVAEAFAHRIISLAGARARTVLDRIPGYPGRLAPAHDGGWWLAVFAPRNRLIELVLREDRFRADMIATVPQDYWIAPALRSGESFLEPLQRGGVRTMGVRKPWAPARSYGLVARLDAQFQPVGSHHSRADGHRHGAVSVLDLPNARLVAFKGAGEIVDIRKREPLA